EHPGTGIITSARLVPDSGNEFERLELLPVPTNKFQSTSVRSVGLTAAFGATSPPGSVLVKDRRSVLRQKSRGRSRSVTLVGERVTRLSVEPAFGLRTDWFEDRSDTDMPASGGSFMERQRFGNSDLTVSAIGLGCYGMSGVYGPADDAESIA